MTTQVIVKSPSQNHQDVQDQCVEIARQAAAACHERHDYMPSTVRLAETWQPHRWVVDAMLCVVDMAKTERDAQLIEGPDIDAIAWAYGKCVALGLENGSMESAMMMDRLKAMLGA